MSAGWGQTEGVYDSDDEVIFMGPVTDRELEISRLLNETICLPETRSVAVVGVRARLGSGSVGDAMADLEDGLRAVALEGTRESCTMHELELPTAGAGRSCPMTSSRLEESAAPLASSEDVSSRQWEEHPSEYRLSSTEIAEDIQQWEELPSEYPPSVPAPAEDSVCEEEEEEEEEPPADGSHWRTLLSDESATEPGDSLDERRETPGALLGALCDELADSSASRAEPALPRASPRAAAVSPRSPSSGGGLLQAMHHQMSSPGGASVAASVDSYHSCWDGTAADDSRRLTGMSGLSELSLAPAAPPNSTLGAESQANSVLYESTLEEQSEREVSHASAAVADDTTSDNVSRSPSLVARDRTVSSLASGCSLAGSCVSGASTGSQSELNDTLEIMEPLLAMKAEERRLETILQSRTAAGESTLQDRTAAGHAGGDSVRHSRDAAGEADGDSVLSMPGERGEMTPGRPAQTGAGKTKTTPAPASRGRPAAKTPGKQRTLAARSPGRLVTPRGRMAPSPARSVTAGRLRTPTPAGRAAMMAPPSSTPRTKPNLADIVSPVARYIHAVPAPPLVQNLRPRARLLNSVVPRPRPTPQKLAPLTEEGAGRAETVLRQANTSNVSCGSRIPIKVTAHAAGGQENKKPQQLPEVSYKSSGNLVMDETAWNKLVRKNTADNRKMGRFPAGPKPVLAVKHTGHKSVASRRVKWNDEFSLPDMAVRVRPIRRSVSDCDITQGSDASYMEVSVCEVRSARPAIVRH